MMKLSLTGFVVSAVLLVGGGADEAALKKDKALFKGTWKIAKVENAKGESDEFKGAEVVFDDAGNLELRKCGETKKATFKLNPKAKPKEIDIMIDDDGGKTIKGIYQIEKNKLKLCVEAVPDSARPTEFAVKDNTAIMIVTMERAK
jgi:uncharacterized protein (TIGR03067 family)